ncbi:DMT family transporter [Ferrimonas senticii]|uniref:DMT family transporter n=1 Tax=Ferrimonas senticii TaxID=394566 RepID=UPI0004881FA6|nr:DMT family transporter [Ferrimonas senticii]
MHPLSPRNGMLLLVLANLASVVSDLCIKVGGAQMPIFQFVLFRQLASLVLLAPLLWWLPQGRWRQGLHWHALRAHVFVLGALCMVPALAHLPIASASALFHSTPLLMLPLAYWWYRESLTTAAITATIIGFIGVLVIVQPTEFNLGAIAALMVALSIAVNNLLIRQLPSQHTVLQTLFLTNLLGVPATFALAMADNQPWDFSIIDTAIGSSAALLLFTGLCVIAFRRCASSQIASAEYTALVWAAIVGLLWFDEPLTVPMLAGAALIVIPMLWLEWQSRPSRLITETVLTAQNTKDV